MHWKKIMPLALAAAIAAAPAAGAAHTQQPDRLILQTQQAGWLCELPDWDIPSQRPESAPDQTPEQAPDTEQTPEEQPDSTPEQTPEQDNGTAQGDYASQVAALVNAVRAQHGLAALTVDTKVQRAAQVRAAETAQSFSHTRPNGSSFSTALTEAGVTYRTAGENIAYGGGGRMDELVRPPCEHSEQQLHDHRRGLYGGKRYSVLGAAVYSVKTGWKAHNIAFRYQPPGKAGRF